MSAARPSKVEAGRRAEEAAAAALRDRGYDIVERNYRCPIGEIDIVARVDGLLVFVEVRSRSGDGFGTAAESVDYRKRRKLARLARHYVAARRFRSEPTSRFDVVAVRLERDGAARHVEVIPDAFPMS